MQKPALSGNDLLCHLLPDSRNLQLEGWQHDKAASHITLTIFSTKVVANCPICNQPASKIHSRYQRKLTDLPWADRSITLQLGVRKFFCINNSCKRRIFTERLAGVVVPWGRQTIRLSERLTSIGLALGGNAGQRLSQQLNIHTSRNKLLQLVRKIPMPPVVTPQILGVDDFCFRKCKTYGTALIDLDQNRPIALLAERSAEVLTEWLKAHPGIKIVSRDRSKAYEKGIRLGAPEAIHVADRFHLLQNLAETLYQVFGAHDRELKAVDEAFSLASTTQKDGTVVVRVPRPSLTTKEQSLSEERRARRLALHQQVWELRRQNLSGKAIARKLGIGVTSVFRYLRTPIFPERQGRI